MWSKQGGGGVKNLYSASRSSAGGGAGLPAALAGYRTAIHSETALKSAALDSGTEVAEEALSCIQQHVDRYRADDFFAGAQDRGALLRFLKPRPGLYARLSQMHDCGLLGRVFPEFQAISWRVVRDFYHKYTVDEHTLLTIRNLERLITTDDTTRMRFRSILLDLQEPELLVLALLFHDVGKWRDDDHALESVRMAEHVLDRLHVGVEQRDTVIFLIRHHLRMSLAAFAATPRIPTSSSSSPRWSAPKSG